jgi:hypothetical protein
MSNVRIEYAVRDCCRTLCTQIKLTFTKCNAAGRAAGLIALDPGTLIGTRFNDCATKQYDGCEIAAKQYLTANDRVETRYGNTSNPQETRAKQKGSIHQPRHFGAKLRRSGHRDATTVGFIAF